MVSQRASLIQMPGATPFFQTLAQPVFQVATNEAATTLENFTPKPSICLAESLLRNVDNRTVNLSKQVNYLQTSVANIPGPATNTHSVHYGNPAPNYNYDPRYNRNNNQNS